MTEESCDTRDFAVSVTVSELSTSHIYCFLDCLLDLVRANGPRGAAELL